MCLFVSAIATDYNETFGVVASQRIAQRQTNQKPIRPHYLTNSLTTNVTYLTRQRATTTHTRISKSTKICHAYYDTVRCNCFRFEEYAPHHLLAAVAVERDNLSHARERTAELSTARRR